MERAARFGAFVRGGGTSLRSDGDRRRDAWRRAAAIVLAIAVAACGAPAISPGATTGSSPTPLTASDPAGVPDVVLTGGTVITLDDAEPRAEAIAIRGDTILAVGSNGEIAALAGDGTLRIELAGSAVVPGFIDAHEHRIGDPGKIGLDSAEPLIQAAIEQGWTTLHELYVDEGRLAALRDLDEAGLLRLRVNAYLPVNENSPEGTLFGDWYGGWRPGEIVSPHVRVAGLKVFTDFDNATILLWSQADLDAFLLARHREGWQLAVKTVSSTSLEMIVDAFRAMDDRRRRARRPDRRGRNRPPDRPGRDDREPVVGRVARDRGRDGRVTEDRRPVGTGAAASPLTAGVGPGRSGRRPLRHSIARTRLFFVSCVSSARPSASSSGGR
ncbi:MAG TPA: hypothetical protein VK871_13700 [Candidatus Limnocylindrales bacterium]|nr:hypothetical protein [Candidatus Limnocylindrales bacterium]